jgi:hypothetical protein
MLFHDINGARDDVDDAAPPTAMNVGHHVPDRFVQENSLAVCNLDHQKFFSDVGDHGVTDKLCRVPVVCPDVVLPADDQDPAAVDLLGKNKMLSPDALRHNAPVFLNMFIIIANAVADIQTIVGRFAATRVSRKNSVVNFRAGCQMAELK